MGTAVQIQNIGESCFSHLLLRLDICQIEDTQQEWVQLKMEGDKPYTVSWWVYLSAF